MRQLGALAEAALHAVGVPEQRRVRLCKRSWSWGRRRSKNFLVEDLQCTRAERVRKLQLWIMQNRRRPPWESRNGSKVSNACQRLLPDKIDRNVIPLANIPQSIHKGIALFGERLTTQSQLWITGLMNPNGSSRRCPPCAAGCLASGHWPILMGTTQPARATKAAYSSGTLHPTLVWTQTVSRLNAWRTSRKGGHSKLSPKSSCNGTTKLTVEPSTSSAGAVCVYQVAL